MCNRDEMKEPIPFPREPGGPIVKDEFPPPPIKRQFSNPAQQAFLAAFLERRDKRSAYLKAYRAKHRDRLLASQRKYDAKKRAERSRYCCLLKHSHPLTRVCPAVATDKPHQ